MMTCDDDDDGGDDDGDEDDHDDDVFCILYFIVHSFCIAADRKQKTKGKENDQNFHNRLKDIREKKMLNKLQ